MYADAFPDAHEGEVEGKERSWRTKRRMEGKQGIGYCRVELAAVFRGIVFPWLSPRPRSGGKNVFQKHFFSRYNTRGTGGIAVYDALEE